jgi:glycosyltransferase involved in cell wall biosynthesis
MNAPRVAVALGKLGSRVHGQLDASRPFDDERAFATGTVSGFWSIVWGLAELGFEVDAYADVRQEIMDAEHLAGANVYHINTWKEWTNFSEGEDDDGTSYDAYLSILESDLLAEVPAGKPRICIQWLNDFSYANADPLEVVDLFACPSRTHADYLARKVMIPAEKITVVPLCSNPELFNLRNGPRRPLSIAYASSPDRGLHHLIEMFPEVRKRVPGAELRVYYRVEPWLDDILSEKAQHGSKHWKRASAVKNAFDRLGTNGENGLYLVGQLTTAKMAAELCQTEILAYPCDPVKFTEGFSVTVLDACAAGAAPIISGVDAFPELWTGAAKIIPGRPDNPGAREEWIRTIVATLTADEASKAANRSMAFARANQLSRSTVAVRWAEVIRGEIAKKKGGPV